MTTEQQNERAYQRWLASQGISRAEHSRQVMQLVHESPVMHSLHLQALKSRLEAKHGS
jgi:hypothetical protein